MKILVADDEDYTREGLIEGIPWEEFEIDEIMQAVNGAEALKIAQWFQPDIVLTDIRMPKLDGIAFVEELLRHNPESKIIFMSGYMEIEYLKSAIRLSAIDYIEKPIDMALVKKSLRKAADEIHEKRKSQEADKSSREFRQQKLFSLLTHKEKDEKTVEKLFEEANFPLNREYICIIIQFPHAQKDIAEKLGGVLQIIQEAEGEAISSYDARDSFLEFIIAYQGKNAYRLRPLCQRILDRWPECKVAAGIEAKDYRNIYNSYRTAKAAMNCAFYQAGQRMFEIDEQILQKRFIEPGIYGNFLRILSENPEKLAEWFQELFGELYSRKYYQKEQVHTLMASLLTALYRQYPEMYDCVPQIAREEQIQACLLEMDTLQEMQEFTQRLLEQLKAQKKEQSGYSRIIRGVLEYIAKHYGEEDLSTVQIADYLHFSSAYLNVLFKQEMKVTLKQYLSNYRLERAKKLLEQDYMKISEIAERCGYANANYFAKVFREAVGMSPLEYRNGKK